MLVALPLLALGLLQPAAGQHPAPATASGGASLGIDLSAALKIPGSLQSRIRFEHLSSADGISNDSVFSILQDRRGFMWFGTQAGLNRYDGYRITQYRHDAKNPSSLGDDFVQTLFEDSQGNIWSGRLFLSRFDRKTETFTRYEPPGRSAIWAITEDRRGYLWLANSGECPLYRFDPSAAKFSCYDIGKDMSQETLNRVEGMYQDTAGILWLGTPYGVVRFDTATGSSIRYRPNLPNPGASEGGIDRIVGIAPGQSGGLWLATMERGLTLFDTATHAFTQAWHMGPRAEALVSTDFTIPADPSGTIWLGTLDGLRVFNPRGGPMGSLRNDPADRYSLSGNDVLSIGSDREGDLWVGVKGGGVNRFSLPGNTFGAWRHDPGDPASLSDNNVRAIYGDRSGGVWIGASGRTAHGVGECRDCAGRRPDCHLRPRHFKS